MQRRMALMLFGVAQSFALWLSIATGPITEAAPVRGIVSTYDWLQFDFNSRHSGNNTQETKIALSSVGNLHRLFRVTLPSIADGAPAYLSGVSTASGVRDLLFVTTKAGHIIALDAHTGTQIWSKQYGANGCISSNGSVCYTTSSPAVDPNRQYVYSYGLDGKVHKYATGDGAETLTANWPQTATLKGSVEKGSSALSIATSMSGTTYLYVTNSGYPGDAGDYQGHVTAINLADNTQRVFNAACSDQTVHFTFTTPDCPSRQTAIWARVGVVYDPDTDKIYMATGNGTYSPANHYWGDSVFVLNPDGTGSNGDPLDTWTPPDFQQLQNTDTDLGSTAPAILTPTLGSNIPHLAVQGGKDAILRLINLDNLSGHSAPGFTSGEIFSMTVPMAGEILTAPAVWMNPSDNSTWMFVANGSGIAGLKLVVNSGNPSLSTMWSQSTNASGTSPIIANGILFYAGSNRIRALDPVTGNQLWRDTSIGGIHWESPIVVNGILYITDESSHLSAYVPNAVYLPLIMK